MRDLIPPAVARNPAEAIEIVSLAISDGDLEAAFAQYEYSAMLRPWQSDPVDGGASASADGGSRDAAGMLQDVMDLRLPLTLRVLAVIPAGDLALVLAERRISGAGPDGQQVELAGSGAAIVRRQPGGGWRMAADAWRLAGIGGPDGLDELDRFPGDSP